MESTQSIHPARSGRPETLSHGVPGWWGRVGESSSPQYRLYHLLILVLAHALRKFSRRQGSPVIEWVNIGITIGVECLLSAHEEVLSVCSPSPLYAWIY